MNANTHRSDHLATQPSLAGILARTGVAQGGAVVQRVRAGPVVVNPTITPTATIIVVSKPHTNPARVPIRLGGSGRVRQTGTLTRGTVATSGGIHIFKTRTAANEMLFDGVDNVFTAAELTAGAQVFATATTASGAANDFSLTLTLTAGPTAGPPVTVSLTAVSLTLDVFMSRTVAGTDGALVPQPTVAVAPAVRTDKWFLGRFVHVQNPPGNNHGRAMIEVTMAPVLAATLVLRRIGASAADVVGAVDNRTRLCDVETPTAGETIHPASLQFPNTSLNAAGKRRFFVQGSVVSGALRDTGYQLGVVQAAGRIENDGDRIRFTVVQFSHLVADVPTTGANTPRPTPPGPASVVNSPVARHSFDITNFAGLSAEPFGYPGWAPGNESDRRLSPVPGRTKQARADIAKLSGQQLHEQFTDVVGSALGDLIAASRKRC